MAFSFFRKKPFAPSATPPPPKSAWREWGDAIVFAVLAATLIRWATFEAYTIPTPSMEGSLLVGDYLFVSKLHYGPTTPITPLQIPLTHQTIPGTTIPSYSSLIQLPQWRLPGFSEVKRGDVVVFHVPFEAQHPPDLRQNYIKRCVAVAGDELTIKNRQLFVNGEAQPNPPGMQFKYLVRGTSVLNEESFYNLGIQTPQPTGNGYIVDCPPALAEKMRTLPFIKHVDLYNSLLDSTLLAAGDPSVFPNDPDMTADAEGMGQRSALPPNYPNAFPWTIDDYGPLRIPKKGETVQLTPQNAPIYVKIITRYEANPGVTYDLTTRQFKQADGQPLTAYTFRQNYYWMMGDNRHNSLDSRFWGFVPEEQIVGKAVFIWMSSNPHPEQGGSSVRWDRLFTTIK